MCYNCVGINIVLELILTVLSAQSSALGDGGLVSLLPCQYAIVDHVSMIMVSSHFISPL